jgi:transposase InsO family protein
MKTTTSTKTIEVLRSIFSRNGIPAQIVSDNGSQFSSDDWLMSLLSFFIVRILLLKVG